MPKHVFTKLYRELKIFINTKKILINLKGTRMVKDGED